MHTNARQYYLRIIYRERSLYVFNTEANCFTNIFVLRLVEFTDVKPIEIHGRLCVLNIYVYIYIHAHSIVFPSLHILLVVCYTRVSPGSGESWCRFVLTLSLYLLLCLFSLLWFLSRVDTENNWVNPRSGWQKPLGSGCSLGWAVVSALVCFLSGSWTGKMATG